MSSMSGHCPTGRGRTWCWPRRAPGLTAIGQVILDPVTGEIQAELVAGYAGRDPEMEEEIAAVQAQYEEQLSQVVGSTDVALGHHRARPPGKIGSGAGRPTWGTSAPTPTGR